MSAVALLPHLRDGQFIYKNEFSHNLLRDYLKYENYLIRKDGVWYCDIDGEDGITLSHDVFVIGINMDEVKNLEQRLDTVLHNISMQPDERERFIMEQLPFVKFAGWKIDNDLFKEIYEMSDFLHELTKIDTDGFRFDPAAVRNMN